MFLGHLGEHPFGPSVPFFSCSHGIRILILIFFLFLFSFLFSFFIFFFIFFSPVFFVFSLFLFASFFSFYSFFFPLFFFSTILAQAISSRTCLCCVGQEWIFLPCHDNFSWSGKVDAGRGARWMVADQIVCHLEGVLDSPFEFCMESHC